MTSDRKDIRLKRSTADRLLDGVKERIIEVNMSDRFVYGVNRAVVFGSYVNSDINMLGDLDIGVELKSKYEGEEHKLMCDKKCEESKLPGIIGWLCWPTEEVYRYIKNRSAYISIHNIQNDSEAIFSSGIMDLPTKRDN